ncbi:MAG: glycosyltransferase family 2 protein [bacterium]|nr:glycosyltransferase family 2 protein [bacterium]
MPDKKLISIIVPVYNEEKNLPLFYQSLSKTTSSLEDRYDFEVIFVNDGSTDNSAEVLEKLSASDSRVKYIEFSRNFGKEIALTAGLGCAKGQAVLTLDADLEHPPEIIPEFISKWESGIEVVIGVREKSDDQNLVRKAGSWLFYKIMDLIGETKIISGETDFRLLDQTVVREFNRFTEKGRIARGLIDWLGFKRDYIFFAAGKRKSGKTRYGFLDLVRLGFSGFISHSLFPLRLAGYLGILITVFSGILGLFMFLNKFVFRDPWGLAFSNVTMLAVFTTFLIGIVLICLGLIALYIANIYQEVINRPVYVIRKKKNL